MMRSALLFFGVAAVAGVIAFTGIVAGIAALSEFIFFVALAIAAIFFVVAMALGK